MPLPIITFATQGSCPHMIPITFLATSSKVLVDGAPAMLLGDQALVSGVCPFTVPTGKPQPCAKAKLLMQSAKVMIENKAAILQSPSDLCDSADQIPNGPVVYTKVQTKVVVT